MALPRFLGVDGTIYELSWVRLKKASEVDAIVPPIPEPNWREDLKLSPPVTKEAGAAFDRRAWQERTIEDLKTGLRTSDGRPLGGHLRIGDKVSFEPSRRLAPGDLEWALSEAKKILAAHDFPLGRRWPAPHAWVWDGGELWWADTPCGGLLDIQEPWPDLGMSGIDRGGLRSTRRLHSTRVMPPGLKMSACGWPKAGRSFLHSTGL